MKVDRNVPEGGHVSRLLKAGFAALVLVIASLSIAACGDAPAQFVGVPHGGDILAIDEHFVLAVVAPNRVHLDSEFTTEPRRHPSGFGVVK